MPTKTFQNLPQAKQEQVLAALVNEFSTHPLADAQVARIIKDCGIARGSFYKYFADLQDAYRYALQEVLATVHVDAFNVIKANHDNSLVGFYQATQNFLGRIVDSPYRKFYTLYTTVNQYQMEIAQREPMKGAAAIPLYIDGQLITDEAGAMVVYQAATKASHAAIQNVLLGADPKVELANLKRLLTILERGEQHVFSTTRN